MKKIVAMGCAAALAGGLVFAADPAANLSLASFSGNAAVTWGADLDAQKTGFNNTTEGAIKINFFGAGDKITEGSDIWAELKIKVDASDLEVKNGGSAAVQQKGATLETAKIHFGENVYVDIKGPSDLKVGNFETQTAIRSTKTSLAGKQPQLNGKNFANGIEVGYTDNNLAVAVDYRSLADGQYTNAYGVGLEASLKDSNEWVGGLAVKAGASYNLMNEYYANSNSETAVTKWSKISDATYLANQIAYGFNAGYKLAIDDKLYVKPMAGVEGMFAFDKIPAANDKYAEANSNAMSAVASVILGWGAEADANAGVPFLDGDPAKKVTPGVSVAAVIPLPTTTYAKAEDWDAEQTIKHDATIVKIIPSFYTGTLESVPALKAGVYGEIVAYNGKVDPVKADSKYKGNKVGEYDKETWGCAKDKDNTMAFGVIAGLSYDYKTDDGIGIKPSCGVRFANAAFVDNGNNKDLFAGLGIQVKKTEAGKTDLYDGDFMNLKAAVDVTGLINNTTFTVAYTSANVLNKIGYVDNPMWNARAGTINFTTKISF